MKKYLAVLFIALLFVNLLSCDKRECEEMAVPSPIDSVIGVYAGLSHYNYNENNEMIIDTIAIDTVEITKIGTDSLKFIWPHYPIGWNRFTVTMPFQQSRHYAFSLASVGGSDFTVDIPEDSLIIVGVRVDSIGTMHYWWNLGFDGEKIQ